METPQKRDDTEELDLTFEEEYLSVKVQPVTA